LNAQFVFNFLTANQIDQRGDLLFTLPLLTVEIFSASMAVLL